MTQRRYGRGLPRPAPMPVEQLSCLLAYDPETGNLIWKAPPRGGQGAQRVKPGSIAGCLNKWGYVVVRINKVLYPAHRVAWYLHTGQWPPDQIDHINETKNDNRIANLRLATQAENTHYRHQNRIAREGPRPIQPVSDLSTMIINDRIDAADLRRILAYNPDTGTLTWAEPRGCNFNKRGIGTVAGSLKPEGYIVVRIGKRIYKAHRLIWTIMTGEWPEQLIDHINGIKSDNRWSNLRAASFSQNMHARSGRGNKSGFRGVFPSGQGFRSQLMFKRKLICGPTRATPEEAYADYCAAARRYHGEFARLD